MSILSYVQQDSPDPQQSTDLATKNYVDSLLSRSGTVVHEATHSSISNGTTTSATFVNIAPWGTLPFTKLYAGTTLRVNVGISAYMSVAGTSVVGVSPTNSSADVAVVGNLPMNVVSTHFAFSFIWDITGRAAGSYTLSMWWHSPATTTTLASDNNDNIWAQVSEVWP
jgi:hypothetical protein